MEGSPSATLNNDVFELLGGHLFLKTKMYSCLKM